MRVIRCRLHQHLVKGVLAAVLIFTALVTLMLVLIDEEFREQEKLENLGMYLRQYRLKADSASEIFYQPPHYANVSAPKRSFHVSSTTLRLLTSPSPYVTLDSQSARDFVFVTAASWEFYGESLKAIERVQEHFPQQRIVFYDLGLTSTQKKRIQTVCRLIYKAFDFKRYPPHVRNLHLYAWKALAIYDALLEHPGVFWIDTSVRLHATSDVIYDDVIRTNGGIFFSSTGHSNFAVTHQLMYEFLPSNQQAMKKLEQRESIVLLYRTKFIYENMVFWLVLCALEEDCIAPIRNRGCKFASGEARFATFAECHRFDQSAVNILMANSHNFPEGNELDSSAAILSVDRNDDLTARHVQYC